MVLKEWGFKVKPEKAKEDEIGKEAE